MFMPQVGPYLVTLLSDKKDSSVSIQETVWWVELIHEEKQPRRFTVIHVFKQGVLGIVFDRSLQNRVHGCADLFTGVPIDNKPSLSIHIFWDTSHTVCILSLSHNSLTFVSWKYPL